MTSHKKLVADENSGGPLRSGWRKHNIPTKEEAKALDGKIFAMLTERESQVLDFFRAQGRKFGVTIQIENEADSKLLAHASNEAQADGILKSANSRINVTVE